MSVGCGDPEGQLPQLMKEMGHTANWATLSVKATLRTLRGTGQGHSMGVQRPEPKTKTAITLQVSTAKKQPSTSRPHRMLCALGGERQ